MLRHLFRDAQRKSERLAGLYRRVRLDCRVRARFIGEKNMKCAICHEETIGRDPVKWGPEFAHRTCVVAFDAGVDVERYRMRDIVKDDAHAMTFQSLGQYRSALIAALRSNLNSATDDIA
jgi:hypothetical protein